MGMKGFERRLERGVEGAFARTFRSGLKPIELARKLAREMERSRSVGVAGQTVVPNHYLITLNDQDLDRFAEVSSTLDRALCDGARDLARDEGYGFMGPVEVELVAGPRMRTGSFSIEPSFREGVGGSGAGSLLLPTGDRVTLRDRVILIGRSPECTVVLQDHNASRRHAEVRPRGTGYVVRDLGSTNGTQVNGVRVTEQPLNDGDELTFGGTSLRFQAS